MQGKESSYNYIVLGPSLKNMAIANNKVRGLHGVLFSEEKKYLSCVQMTEADDSYVLTVLGGLALVGLMIQIFFGGTTTADGSSGPASAAAWGYGLVALSLASLLFVTFALTSKIQTRLGAGPVKFAREILDQSMPVLLLLIVVGWVIGLNLAYWKQINQGRVPAEYGQFTTLTAVMIGLEVVLVLKWLADELAITGRASRQGGELTTQDKTDILKGNQMRYISYVVTALNFVFVTMMTVVLRYFSTDG